MKEKHKNGDYYYDKCSNTLLRHEIRVKKKTCDACPEQYEVYTKDDELIGYLRLRHGCFNAIHTKTPTCVAYSAYTKGDGIFDDDDERYRHLYKGIKAIIRKYNNHNDKGKKVG